MRDPRAAILAKGGSIFFAGFTFIAFTDDKSLAESQRRFGPMFSNIPKDAWIFDSGLAAAQTRQAEPELREFEVILLDAKVER